MNKETIISAKNAKELIEKAKKLGKVISIHIFHESKLSIIAKVIYFV